MSAQNHVPDHIPPVRRVVTGHENGKAVFRSIDDLDPVVVPSGDAAMALIWTTASIPADNDDETDGRERDAGLTISDQGSVIRTVDMLPGEASPMHRTNSVDYGIVLSGHIILELDDGVEQECGPGDIIVQRGTMHRWRNDSPHEPCRIVFVLIDATPATVDGVPLPELHP
jgi:quercetin dioxygenase-like cupin family protein